MRKKRAIIFVDDKGIHSVLGDGENKKVKTKNPLSEGDIEKQILVLQEKINKLADKIKANFAKKSHESLKENTRIAQEIKGYQAIITRLRLSTNLDN
jgi:hypothetical protein